MAKLLVLIATLALLSACEQQKIASTEVGAIPKEILDKATNDLNAAQELAADKMKAAESENAPADVSQ